MAWEFSGKVGPTVLMIIRIFAIPPKDISDEIVSISNKKSEREINDRHFDKSEEQWSTSIQMIWLAFISLDKIFGG